jgi:spore coat protein SA
MAEWECFSNHSGGAISRDVANIMRFDESRVVVTPKADETWGYQKDRILLLPALKKYARIKGKRFIPLWLSKLIIVSLFKPLLNRLKPGDIVWIHDQPSFSIVLLDAIHKRGAKHVHHSHSSVAALKARGVFRGFVPDALVFVSDAMKEEGLPYFPPVEKVFAVHNGVDEKLFYPAATKDADPDSPATIIFVGRLVAEKGIGVLVDAMRLLQERGLNAICKVFGSSFSGASELGGYAQRLVDSAPSNVTFEGYCSGENLAREFRDADVLCCPSVWQEPFGNVNVEAMASRTAVVASRVGGIPEIASEGGVLLVEPGSATALCNALERVISDDALRKRLADEGYASFQRRFTWAAIFEQIDSITCEL